MGPAEVHVTFEGNREGIAFDDDLNGFDEVDTEIVSMDLRGTSPLGPVTVGLRQDVPSTGQIAEQMNRQPGILEVAPFTTSPLPVIIPADSIFDVWPEITIGDQTLVTARPLRLETLIYHKPPEDGERYVNPYLRPVELIDPVTGQGTGIFVVREVHQPDPTIEHDVFSRTRAVVGLELIGSPGAEPISIVMNGPSAWTCTSKVRTKATRKTTTSTAATKS